MKNRILTLKRTEIGYDNTSYSFRNEKVKIDFTFGLLEIIINNKVVYSKVFKVNGLSEKEKIEIVKPIICNVLFNHDIFIYNIKVGNIE